MRTKVTQKEVEDAIGTLQLAIGLNQLQCREFGKNIWVDHLYITGTSASLGQWSSDMDDGTRYYPRRDYNHFIVVDTSVKFNELSNQATKKLEEIRKKEITHAAEVKKAEDEVKYFHDLALKKAREE